MMNRIITGVLLLIFTISPFFSNAQDIDCKNAINTCLTTPDPCACQSNPPPQVKIDGPEYATEGSTYNVLHGTGRAGYRFSIGAGSINSDTGSVTSVPSGCPTLTTVTVTDACGKHDSMSVQIADHAQLTISGPETLEVGTVYSASGGSGDYTFSFNGGEINPETGEIISITECGGPDGNGAVGQVSVWDDCGMVDSMDVRLSGGRWVIVSQGDSIFWTTAHIVAEEISGGTKVRKLYPPAGCLGFKQTLLTPAGAYRCYQYRDDSGDTSGYWYNSYSGWSDGYIFDESPCGPEPVPEKVASRDISGFLSFDSGYGSSSNSTCRINGGNNYEVWAFQMYSHNSAYDIVYEWQCP